MTTIDQFSYAERIAAGSHSYWRYTQQDFLRLVEGTAAEHGIEGLYSPQHRALFMAMDAAVQAFAQAAIAESSGEGELSYRQMAKALAGIRRSAYSPGLTVVKQVAEDAVEAYFSYVHAMLVKAGTANPDTAALFIHQFSETLAEVTATGDERRAYVAAGSVGVGTLVLLAGVAAASLALGRQDSAATEAALSLAAYSLPVAMVEFFGLYLGLQAVQKRVEGAREIVADALAHAGVDAFHVGYSASESWAQAYLTAMQGGMVR